MHNEEYIVNVNDVSPVGAKDNRAGMECGSTECQPRRVQQWTTDYAEFIDGIFLIVAAMR